MADNNLSFLSSLNAHDGGVNIIRFSPDSRYLASAGDDKIVALWHKTDEKWTLHHKLKAHVAEIYSLSWSSNSKFLFSGSLLSELVLWDIDSREPIQRLELRSRFLQGLAVDPLGLFVVALSNDGSLRFFVRKAKRRACEKPKFKKFKVLEKFEGERLFAKEVENGFYRKLEWSPEGEFLATSSGRFDKNDKHSAAIFCRDNLMAPRFLLSGFVSVTNCARWSPVWHVPDQKNERKRTFELSENGQKIESDKRRMLAISSMTEMVLFSCWESACEQISRVERLHYAPITDLAWSKDGRKLMVSSMDGYCSVLDVDFESLGICILGDGDME
ncbi:Chromatin assembly factor 1 subunit B [Bonamia ostreae]|uniref:Chromatin assembly factor 1 subunit B n=1 Tax=Bonamia ostreae TaxID=126728 RepID=A0ABV2AH52_9EUKA